MFFVLIPFSNGLMQGKKDNHAKKNVVTVLVEHWQNMFFFARKSGKSLSGKTFFSSKVSINKKGVRYKSVFAFSFGKCKWIVKKVFLSSYDMQKDRIFKPTRLVPKLLYPKKCVNYNKISFLTKLCKRPKRPKKQKQGHNVT